MFSSRDMAVFFTINFFFSYVPSTLANFGSIGPNPFPAGSSELLLQSFYKNEGVTTERRPGGEYPESAETRTRKKRTKMFSNEKNLSVKRAVLDLTTKSEPKVLLAKQDSLWAGFAPFYGLSRHRC